MGATNRWEWLAEGRRYRDTRTGRSLSPAAVIQRCDDSLDDCQGVIARLVAGDVTVGDWLLAMRDLVRELAVGEYAFGRGGVRALGDDDRAACAEAIRAQLGYLQAFAEAARPHDGRRSAATTAHPLRDWLYHRLLQHHRDEQSRQVDYWPTMMTPGSRGGECYGAWNPDHVDRRSPADRVQGYRSTRDTIR